MTRFQSGAKRVVDVFVSSVALAMLSPLMLLIALAVWGSSCGPALLRSQRLGKDGVPFTLYKFRSMFLDAPDIRNPDGSTFSSGDDSRVTRLGRLLRRTSLDELPQLINVLKGDMSMVGPRPDLADQLQYYDSLDRRKLAVKPGLSGLTQISGRNTIPWKLRRQMDVHYVENYSMWQDLRILLRTVPCALMGKGVFAKSVGPMVHSIPIPTRKEERQDG